MKYYIETLENPKEAAEASALLDYLDQHRSQLSNDQLAEIKAVEDIAHASIFVEVDQEKWHKACDRLYALIKKHFNLK